jgi:hypothetical protein
MVSGTPHIESRPDSDLIYAYTIRQASLSLSSAFSHATARLIVRFLFNGTDGMIDERGRIGNMYEDSESL